MHIHAKFQADQSFFEILTFMVTVHSLLLLGSAWHS